MTTISVVIADDHAMVRAGFVALLSEQSDLEVVGQAENGAECVGLVARLRPAVVVMDLSMPIMNGIEATREIVRESSSRVLMLTTYDTDDYVYESIRAGASGYLLKDSPPGELINAVRVIAAGDALLAPSITRRLIEQFAASGGPSAPHGAALDRLTERERDVLVAVARGLSNSEIAKTLFIAEQTVKTHVSRMLTKLGLRDRAQLVVAAYESGLVTPRQ
ncbi:response regulator [Microlunatus speluncae]|uniref:response regulator n=1 Tax=Microlunatus speluncae TaxID=2594267 RepID=UPI001C2D47FE|nr:response regulator transcription factor [Microlunatus speluncae]